ncbi:MAG: tetratricopeptide repeat protein [Nitrospinota bacterium]
MKGRGRKIFLFLALAWVFGAHPAAAQEAEKGNPALEAFSLWQRGYVYHLLGQYQLAIAHFRKSIEVRPSAEGHTFLGWSLSMLGRHEEAIAECKKAIPLDPDFGNPYNDIGVYLVALGRLDEAIPYLKKAMRAKRYCCYQFAHYNMGRVLVLKGREGEAMSFFEKALEYDPNYEPALQALRALRKKGLRTL